MIKIEIKLYSDCGLYEGCIFNNGCRIHTIYKGEKDLDQMKKELKEKLHGLVDCEVDNITKSDFLEY